MSAVRAQRVAAVHGSDDSPAQRRPSRILVIGTSGSGKSTLARRISARLGIPVTATDDLYWRPGWARVPGDEVIDTVLTIAAGDRWVLDGNFDGHRRVLWPLAELVIWLDMPWTTTMWGVAARNLGWVWSRRAAWSGNRMTIGWAVSGIRHTVRTHGLKRKHYPIWLEESGVAYARLRSRGDVERWVGSI